MRAPGDYQMDLRRLREGSIDAAYVGSTLSPEQVAEEEGFHLLAWVGDHFQIPTVGVAVDPARIPLDSPALQALVRANQRALRTIAEKPDLAVDYIASFLNRLTRDEAQQYYERYIGPYFTPDGQVDLDVAQQAIDAVAAELGVAPCSRRRDLSGFGHDEGSRQAVGPQRRRPRPSPSGCCCAGRIDAWQRRWPRYFGRSASNCDTSPC